MFAGKNNLAPGLLEQLGWSGTQTQGFLFCQSGTPYMFDYGIAVEPEGVPSFGNFPAQVKVFDVEEVGFIKAQACAQQISSDKHQGASDERGLEFFNGWCGYMHSGQCPGPYTPIFKLDFLAGGIHYLAANDARFGVALGSGGKGIDAALFQDCIGIDQEHSA